MRKCDHFHLFIQSLYEPQHSFAGAATATAAAKTPFPRLKLIYNTVKSSLNLRFAADYSITII